MSKLKKGDSIELNRDITFNLKKGQKAIVTNKKGVLIAIECELFTFPEYINKTEGLKLDYINSNRYKLHKAASATGFSFSKLSRTMGRSDTYISNESKESRFNSRGDLTYKRYNQLIVDLAYAERTLNGNPAKVVDDSIDIETESLCIEKRFELVEKDAAPAFTPKQKIKSKTEVNKSIVWFILFALIVVILVLVAGIYKSIF